MTRSWGVLLLCSGCSLSSGGDAKRAVVEIFAAESEAGAAPVNAITETEYKQALARARLTREGGLHAEALPSALKEHLLSELVDNKILLGEAERLKVEASTVAVAREIEMWRASLTPREMKRWLTRTYQREPDLERRVGERLRIANLMRAAAHEGVRVSNVEIQEAWDALAPDQKRLPRLAWASQIVVRTEEQGTALRARLKKGEGFAELAREFSLGPEASAGGDLGWFEEGVMPRVFDDVCFSLKPGQISDLTPSDYGFHIFQVHQIEDSRALSLEEMRSRLGSRILHRKLQVSETKYLSALRQKFRVQRDQRLIARIE